jgi:hypothetical protein
MRPLPATVIGITPESIIIPVTLEAFVSPPVPVIPFALSTALPIETLPFIMPSEVVPIPIPVTIIVAIKPLRFCLRPAADAGEGYESYGQGGSGQKL